MDMLAIMTLFHCDRSKTVQLGSFASAVDLEQFRPEAVECPATSARSNGFKESSDEQLLDIQTISKLRYLKVPHNGISLNNPISRNLRE